MTAEEMTAEEEALDELACRAFNPDNHICVGLPSGAYATVAPDCPPETLAALDQLAVAAFEHFTEAVQTGETPCKSQP